MKKALPIIFFLLFIGAGLALFFYFDRGRRQELKIFEQEKVLDSMQEELDRLQSQKESLSQKNKKLLSDLVASMDLNNELREKNKDLQKIVEDYENKIAKLEAELANFKKTESQKEKQVKQEKGEKSRAELLSDIAKLEDEKKALEEEKDNFQIRLKKERALHHYNLGVMYTKLKEYDKAISEFKKSLDDDSNNPDTYYNLGFLYKEEKNNPLNAAVYYRKYLELKPEADDAEKVKNFISELLFQEE